MSSAEISVKTAYSERLVLMQLLYFAIFEYPLTFEEILRFSHQKVVDYDLQRIVNRMVEREMLFSTQEYYMLRPDSRWIEKRIENNRRAKIFKKRARWMTGVIRQFPFVKAVFLSGALSKDVMPKDGDIDYFIVTKHNRLWIARTLLILFKKIFLLNSHKYFCLNYFIDEGHLEIEEKNRFTATEIITLIPVYNEQTFVEFLQKNRWITDYFPNFKIPHDSGLKTRKSRGLKFVLEKIMNFSFFERLELYFMQKTLSYWKRKFGSAYKQLFDVALKSNRHISKHHPDNFQERVRLAYEELIDEYEVTHHAQLNRQKHWKI